MRIWTPKAKQILIDTWGKQSAAEIAQSVNLWHKDNAVRALQAAREGQVGS